MSRQAEIRRDGGRAAARVLVAGLAVASVALNSARPLRAQFPPTANANANTTTSAPASAPMPVISSPMTPPCGPPPGRVVVENGAAVGAPALPPEVQVVRFQGPAGIKVEVLGPPPEPVSPGDGHGLLTVGLKVGQGYRLRLSNLPDRPGAELFPVIEVVGHLHRPEGIDPSRFPIRVSFTEDDLIDAADGGRLVTLIVYLEDPAQALPMALPKDEIPVVTLSPSEEPLRVAKALGRVQAIVRIGGRRPSAEEMSGEGLAGVGLSGMGPPTRCPFVGAGGNPCGIPCGPVRGTPPPQGRSWLPRDEFLCDGGDHAEPAHFGGDGNLSGVDPRDAMLRFDDGRRSRVLPTNMVCVYAPRFAEVRAAIGPNEHLTVQHLVRNEFTERQVTATGEQYARKFVQREAAEIDRGRVRPSGLIGRVYAGEHTELRVLAGVDTAYHVSINLLLQGPEAFSDRQKAITEKELERVLGIKTAEGPVVTGIIQGAGQQVMTWPPREVVGVEVPPNRPGMAVIKRVSAGVAEPGEVLTFAIQFRNMGNTPIGAVSIVDSLLPRFEYIAGSSQGPKGTVFTAAENRAGSTELRWDLPGQIAPGAEGHVLFQVRIR